jgi:putative ABC transport system permease protein
MIAILRKSPRAMLRSDINVNIGSRFIISISKILLDGLPVAVRYGVRNLFRRPYLAISSIILIGFAISVAIAYGLSTTSYNKSMFTGLEQEKWDYVVDFTHPVFDDELSSTMNPDNIKKVSPYFRGFVEAGFKSKAIDTRILGLNLSDSMRSTNVISGMPLTGLTDNEVVIAKDIARDLHVNVGDTITTKYQDLKNRLAVVGISGDLNLRQMTMNYHTAQLLCGYSDKATGLYILVADKNKTVSSDKNYIAKITSFHQMYTSLQKIWNDALVIVYVATGFCSAMVIIFIIMFVMLSISEREAEYATLLSAGYDKGSMLKIVFSEIMTQIVIAIMLSIPMGILLSKFLNYRLSQSFFKIFFSYQITDFIKPPVLAFVLAAAVAYFAAINIIKQDIAPKLRSRSID